MQLRADYNGNVESVIIHYPHSPCPLSVSTLSINGAIHRFRLTCYTQVIPDRSIYWTQVGY